MADLQTYLLERVYLPTETLGSIYDPHAGLVAKSMELPWADNQNNISCVPEGIYEVTKEPPIPANDPRGFKERKYWHFRFKSVPKRKGILIHKITYVKDLQGCIGVGGKFVDLNKDGVPDIADSTIALQHMVDTMPDVFKLRIVSKSGQPYK